MISDVRPDFLISFFDFQWFLSWFPLISGQAYEISKGVIPLGPHHRRDSGIFRFLAWFRDSCSSCLPNKGLWIAWFIIYGEMLNIQKKRRNCNSRFKNLHLILWFQQWFLEPSTWFGIVADPSPVGTIASYTLSLYYTLQWMDADCDNRLIKL